jgi:signal transduction histidine kinase
MAVVDSLAKEEIFQHNKNLQILYETRETEKENAGLKDKLDVKNLFLLTFAVIIVLIGLLLMILQGKRNQQICLNKILNQKNEEISTQRDRLEEINQTKDKLFSIIAHDLRGPIGSTSAFLEVLTTNENEFTKDELRNNLILLKNSSNATFKLLENLLTWALTQRGEIVFNPSSNDLVRLVQSNVDLFASNAENKKIQIINELDHQLIFEFDHDMINTVMRNLINNAIKYTGENGQITISAKETLNDVEICIKDTGIGMDDTAAQKLFITDRSRIRQEGTKGEKGTGLGLILCKEFVGKHQGKIWVESEQGKGSKFKITLPLSHAIKGIHLSKETKPILTCPKLETDLKS